MAGQPGMPIECTIEQPFCSNGVVYTCINGIWEATGTCTSPVPTHPTCIVVNSINGHYPVPEDLTAGETVHFSVSVFVDANNTGNCTTQAPATANMVYWEYALRTWEHMTDWVNMGQVYPTSWYDGRVTYDFSHTIPSSFTPYYAVDYRIRCVGSTSKGLEPSMSGDYEFPLPNTGEACTALDETRCTGNVSEVCKDWIWVPGGGLDCGNCLSGVDEPRCVGQTSYQCVDNHWMIGGGLDCIQEPEPIPDWKLYAMIGGVALIGVAGVVMMKGGRKGGK